MLINASEEPNDSTTSEDQSTSLEIYINETLPRKLVVEE
jgi:hypothetical protein